MDGENDWFKKHNSKKNGENSKIMTVISGESKGRKFQLETGNTRMIDIINRNQQEEQGVI